MPTDNPDILGQVAATPSIDPAGVTYLREILARPNFEKDHPAHFAMLKQQIADIEASGLVPAAPVDPRSGVQKVVDRQFGMVERTEADYHDMQLPRGFEPGEGTTSGEVLDGARTFAAALGLEPNLARGVIDGMLSND